MVTLTLGQSAGEHGPGTLWECGVGRGQEPRGAWSQWAGGENAAVGLMDQGLDNVVDDVPGPKAALSEVILVEKAEGFAWKKKKRKKY